MSEHFNPFDLRQGDLIYQHQFLSAQKPQNEPYD